MLHLLGRHESLFESGCSVTRADSRPVSSTICGGRTPRKAKARECRAFELVKLLGGVIRNPHPSLTVSLTSCPIRPAFVRHGDSHSWRRGVDLESDSRGSESRFAAYVETLTTALGHAERAAPFRSYCTGWPAEERRTNGGARGASAGPGEAPVAASPGGQSCPMPVAASGTCMLSLGNEAKPYVAACGTSNNDGLSCYRAHPGAV
jgi:hypothetical protein